MVVLVYSWFGVILLFLFFFLQTADNEAYNETEADELTEPSRKTSQRSELEILVEEVPLAALIGIPVAVVILLVGTIAWCCFTTRKHQALLQNKANQYPPQHHKKFDFLSNADTRNAGENVYIDCSNGKTESRRISPEIQAPHGSSLDSNKQPPLEDLVVHTEHTVTHSNRLCHSHKHNIEKADEQATR